MAGQASFCSIFALLYYWSSAALLFGQAALAINRWSLVCTVKYRLASSSSMLGCQRDSSTDMAARVPLPMVQYGTLLVDPWAAISYRCGPVTSTPPMIR